MFLANSLLIYLPYTRFGNVIREDNAGHNHINNLDRKRWTGTVWIDRTAKHNKVNYPKEKIKLKTLDSYKFKDVDIIKLDVEGYEYDVMLGMEKTVDKWKPIVQVEMVYGQPHRFGHSVHEILDYFKKRDYIMTLSNGEKLEMIWVNKNAEKFTKKGAMPVRGKMERFFIHKDHQSWNIIQQKPYNRLFEEV